MNPLIIPVIMAGGSGSRLWPLSREQYPKQFLKLIDSHWSLLQVTAQRAAALLNVAPPVVICGEEHRFLVAEQMRAAGFTDAQILIEPVARNTGPAAACAAHLVAEIYGPDALMLLMAADHHIPDQAAFAQAVAAATTAATQGKIVTFGIKPTRAETGYGYIRVGPELSAGVFHLQNFVEKPSKDRAEAYLADGGYYWNGGLFMLRASILLAELAHFEPEILQLSAQAVSQRRQDLDFSRLDGSSFSACKDISIDYAVMEKTQKAAVVPLDAGWDDVGAWTFMDGQVKDPAGNVVRGDVMLENAHGNLVRAESRLVALVGVSDHIVVETQDAVLITTREHAQDIKKIVNQLKNARRPEAIQNPKAFRPWGSYEALVISDRFQVKRIIVRPQQRLSLQMHHHRAEHWIVVKGTAEVTIDDNCFLLTENQSCYIPVGAKHRLNNPGKLALELIEVQVGGYLGEDDIVRFDDVYGRVSENPKT